MKLRIRGPVVPATALAAAVVCAAAPAWATNGMLPHCVGVYNCGMGGAGIALATDASVQVLNPALLGRLGTELSASAGWFHPVRTLTPRDLNGSGFPNTAAGTMTSDVEHYPDGALAFNYRLSPTWAVGVALAPGGGGETSYDQSRTNLGQFAIGSVDGQPYDRFVRIRFATLNGTVAWSPTPNASYGLGLVLGYQDFKSDMLTGDFTETDGNGDVERVYGAGLRLGGVWDLGKSFTVGLAGNTPIWFQRLEQYDDLFTGPIDLPASVGGGVTWHASPQTDIAVDLKVVMWNKVGAIGREPARGFGWENQPVFAIGVQHRLNEDWTLRAGYNYGKSPIPEDQTFANGLFPAIVEHHLGVGATWRVAEQWEASVAAFHVFENSQTDPGTGGAFSQAGRGTEISMYQWGALVGIKKKF